MFALHSSATPPESIDSASACVLHTPCAVPYPLPLTLLEGKLYLNKPLFVRSLTYADALKAHELVQSLTLSEQGSVEEGFLLGLEHAPDLERLFSEGMGFGIFDETGTLLAFIAGCWSETEWFQGKISFDGWKRPRQQVHQALPELPELFFYIDKIAAVRGLRRTGMSKYLYTLIIQQLPQDTPLVAFIVERPWYNAPSVGFHEALGFLQIGSLERPPSLQLPAHHLGVFLKFCQASSSGS